MKLRYKLTGTGWSEASLEDKDHAVTLSASYLSDALGELARGALAVLRRSGEVRFSFDEEPGEYRWILKRMDTESYALSIIEFTELFGNKPDDTGEVVFSHVFSRIGFGKMVLKALEDVLHEHGEAGYKEKWHMHDFPTSELSALHALLDEEGE
jgi:hypothetical protein